MNYKEKFISLINDETLPIEQRKKLEEIFNACNENEDERIRKALIQFFQRFPYDRLNDENLKPKEAIAWLEKQGGQKWSAEDESVLQGIWDEILANKHEAKEYDWKTYDKFLAWLNSLKKRIEE
jgi:hypothetical protein